MADQQAVLDASLELFTRCARALAKRDELDDALEDLLRAAMDAVDADGGAFLLLDDDRGELLLTVGIGLSEPGALPDATAENGPYAFPLVSDDRIADAAREGRSVAVGEGTPRPARLLEMTRARAGLFVPLQVTRDGIDQVVGVLALCWAEGGPDAGAEAIAEPVADLAAVAIERARSVAMGAERADWQQRLAHTDPLTGLANRRTFDRMLELELARAARQGSDVTLAVFDLDGFAETNRVSGRPAGDEMLRQVASVLAESVRMVDTVGRYGADEFVVVAPGSAGATVARRVLDGVARLPEIGGRRISVSAGIATFPSDAASREELLSAALANVGSAKAAGGGTVAERT